MQQLTDDQLKQGDPNPNLEYTAVGRPQISIMTISGNDVGFSTVINNCVIQLLSVVDCDTTLANVASQIDSQGFQNSLIDTFTHVLAAGRQAEGATPPESFQVYVAGYVQFWNDDDPGCNDVSYNFWGFSTPKLTTDVRHRMNVLVDRLNAKIKSVARQMSGLGVIYVDGFQSSYDTHRFCEPAPRNYLSKPVGKDTWFWHHLSDDLETGGEGPDTPSTVEESNGLRELLLDYLMPDKSQQALMTASNPPSAINAEAFGNEEAFYAAIDKATGDNATAKAWLSENFRRMFHPKGSAYAPYATSFMDVIKANRDLAGSSLTTPAGPPAPSPSPYAGGVCSFHMAENEAPCVSQSEDFSASILLKDNSEAEIGNTKGFASIDANNPLYLDSKLLEPLAVTGEHQGDYVQFTYGRISWTNKTPMMNGTVTVAHCNNGGWDPREGPSCGRISQKAQRNMDCFFQC
ncbi:hypothetical protein M409DRAFT_22975 [Zasmidium cellare ATCC 36951]|uniref:Uncharacterized protein n=1 Tax=Zasmidium cellare ATCC 36951 TaxID=1080233 RepID=A0A6A6CJX9_ZASCE|nr:uncharacterized protein M409DRAFT_22975 [Zasmidium cellare ATCC 36951]KAF2166923.1 hypothetical protein M409DRAFT_22975 [Zasmidium cellare ATCC 36951]